MSTELEELYQEVILDHSRRPRNFGTLPSASNAPCSPGAPSSKLSRSQPAKPLFLRKPSPSCALSTYFEVIPIVFSQVSNSCGQSVIGNFVRRKPNACPPSAYKCISTGTPAFFSAM